MKQADKVMQLLDNHRHICLQSGGTGTYWAKCVHLKPIWKRSKRSGILKRIGFEPVEEAEVEGATPSEALAGLTEVVKVGMVEDHRGRVKNRRKR